MTVGDFKRILSEASDDEGIYVTRTYYNGDKDRTVTENVVVVLANEGIVITDIVTIKLGGFSDQDFVILKGQ